MVGQTKCQRLGEPTLKGAHTAKENRKHHCNNARCAANDPNYAVPDYITQAQKAVNKLRRRKRTPRSASIPASSSGKNSLQLAASLCAGEIEPMDEVYRTPLTTKLLRQPTPPPRSASLSPQQQPSVEQKHGDPSIPQRTVSPIRHPSCSPTTQEQRASPTQPPQSSPLSPPPIQTIFKTNSMEIEPEAVTTKHVVKSFDLSDLSDASSVNTICSVCFRSACSVCGKTEAISGATSSVYKCNPLYNVVGPEENGDSSHNTVRPSEGFGSPKGISSSNYRMFALEFLCLLVLGGLLTMGFIPYFESSFQSYLSSYCSCSQRDRMAPDPSLMQPKVTADGLHRGIMHWIHCPVEDIKPIGTTVIK